MAGSFGISSLISSIVSLLYFVEVLDKKNNVLGPRSHRSYGLGETPFAC